MEKLFGMLDKRKSVRKFDMTLFPKERLDGIKAYLAAVPPLFLDIKTEFKFVGRENIKGLIGQMLAIDAPHYVIAWTEKKPGALENIGFILEKLELYLAAEGIGAVYLGGSRPKNVDGGEGLEHAMILAFGKLSPAAGETLYRAGETEYKRKPLSEINAAEGADDIIKLARLAPSAFNSQNWFFTGDGNKLDLHRAKLINPIKVKMMDEANQVDMGIVCAFVEIAAAHAGKKTAFEIMKNVESPKGFQYVMSIFIR